MSSSQTQLYYSFFAALTVLTIIFGVFAFSIFHHLRKRRKQLKAKSYQDECNLEADRKRIAADLHDDFGSLLTGLKLSLGELARREPSNYLFTSSSEQLNESMSRLREISLNLLPRELATEGLNAAVESLVERINQSKQLILTFSTIADVDQFDIQKAMLLFRIIQEMTTNAIKHSHASCIEIGIAKRDSFLILEVRDDGQGFDYEFSLKKMDSSGLKNIKSRVDLLNGILVVDSQNGTGTHCYIKIPLRQLLHESNS